MKHLFLCAALLFGAVGMLGAAEAAPCSASCDDFANWTFISLMIGPGIPGEAEITPVCGVKVGAPIGVGKAPVAGVDCAVLYAGTETAYGLQASLIMTDAKKVSGVQFSIVNFAERVDGLQLGVFNSARESAFQFGLLNHIEGARFPWLPIVNFKF